MLEVEVLTERRVLVESAWPRRWLGESVVEPRVPPPPSGLLIREVGTVGACTDLGPGGRSVPFTIPPSGFLTPGPPSPPFSFVTFGKVFVFVVGEGVYGGGGDSPSAGGVAFLSLELLLERLGLLCRLVLGEVYLILIVFAVSTLVYGISFSSASVSPCVPCISNSRCRRSSSGNRLFLASEGDLDRDLCFLWRFLLECWWWCESASVSWPEGW